ncbi:MAG: PDZ domain-containing protein [Sedimentisphaerales bacterium]|nr:PDZ domain-containing protein [Sedimentisphaerales bacterium]
MPDMKYNLLKILNISLLTLLIIIGLMFYFKSPDNSDVVWIEQNANDNQPALPDNGPANVTTNTQVTESLFGTTNLQAELTSQENASLPEGIKLKGTITGPPEIARAIIEIDNNAQNKPETAIMKIGETLAGEFTIIAINRDHIVLKVKNEELKLWIAAEKKQTAMSLPPKTVKSQSSDEPVTLVLPINEAENRKLSESLNIDTQWSLAKDSNDKTIGIKLEDIKPYSPMALCGLQNGDIIKSINNQKLNNYQQTYQVLQKARVKKKIRLEVVRNGKTYEFENALTDGN